jgi:hypothetical protein
VSDRDAVSRDTFSNRHRLHVERAIRVAWRHRGGAPVGTYDEVRSRVFALVAKRLAADETIDDLHAYAFVCARGAILNLGREVASDAGDTLVTDPIESAVIGWVNDHAPTIATGDVLVTTEAIWRDLMPLFLQITRRAAETMIGRILRDTGWRAVRPRTGDGVSRVRSYQRAWSNLWRVLLEGRGSAVGEWSIRMARGVYVDVDVGDDDGDRLRADGRLPPVLVGSHADPHYGRLIADPAHSALHDPRDEVAVWSALWRCGLCGHRFIASIRRRCGCADAIALAA